MSVGEELGLIYHTLNNRRFHIRVWWEGIECNTKTRKRGGSQPLITHIYTHTSLLQLTL